MTSYFFVGIGGSGMLPLASIVRARGADVAGSDRALDQGRSEGKFDYLRAQGIALFPQDGSGVASPDQVVVASAAIEDTVPDIAVAARLGCHRITRAELLAKLFNAAPVSVAVGGTSGKSTVTGMIGWILHHLGRRPTIMNGAVMKNFAGADAPFASAVVGAGEAFVSEVDESDGSIALYTPDIAVVTNITLDHKPMDELVPLFERFAAGARVAILNLDDTESARLMKGGNAVTYAIDDIEADIIALDVEPLPAGIRFKAVECGGAPKEVTLAVPGLHNVSNALAALAAVRAAGVPLAEAATAIAGFAGLRRRLEVVGTANGVTVIDDFAHNPDKIAATLQTLHAFPGRLLLFFQPHGYGPLKVLGDALVETLSEEIREEDVLILSDPAYFGGTVDRSLGSAEVVAAVAARGRRALYVPARADCGAKLAELARAGDRILIMGARDDTLAEFAADVLTSIESRPATPPGTPAP